MDKKRMDNPRHERQLSHLASFITAPSCCLRVYIYRKIMSWNNEWIFSVTETESWHSWFDRHMFCCSPVSPAAHVVRKQAQYISSGQSIPFFLPFVSLFVFPSSESDSSSLFLSQHLSKLCRSGSILLCPPGKPSESAGVSKSRRI